MPINKILAFFKFDKHLTRKLTLYLVILATISAITTYITITSISSPLGTKLPTLPSDLLIRRTDDVPFAPLKHRC